MGFKLERVRANKKVSEVMQHLGVSDAAVYQWESGDCLPKTDKLMKLAKFYGCSVDALLTDNPVRDSK